MQTSVEFKLEVNATPQKLWDIITDAQNWPQWQGTRFIRLESPGPLTKGSLFSAELGGVRWRIMVIDAVSPTRIAWCGNIPGLRGTHEWEFNEFNGKTTAITREIMTGWLLLLTYPVVKRRLSNTDKKWLADLKTRAENT